MVPLTDFVTYSIYIGTYGMGFDVSNVNVYVSYSRVYKKNGQGHQMASRGRTSLDP